MLDKKHELSIKEEKKNIATICSLIRTLQSIECEYNSGHIDREKYTKETNKILDQYENVTFSYPEYEGLDNFVKHYKLEDCNLAINHLKRDQLDRFHYSNSKIALQKNKQLFYDLNLILDCEGLCVADIIQMYSELWISLEDLKDLINL